MRRDLFPSQASVTIGFLGNCAYDARTSNLIHSLKARGHPVFFVGFDDGTPGFRTIRQEDRVVYRLRKGRFSLGYYLRFAFLLGARLVCRRSAIYWAADFYCLPFCFLASRLWGGCLFYDSREIYTGIAGFTRRPWILPWIRALEGFLIRRCDRVFVTGKRDAEYLERLYRIPQPMLLPNLPRRVQGKAPVSWRPCFPIPPSGKVLVYQGLWVEGRGLETAIETLVHYPEGGLVLLGWGEEERYRRLASALGVFERVFFAGKVSQAELLRHTAGGDVGLALIQPISLNHRYAAPNKVFEYLMAGLPVIVTDLPQMREVVEGYGVGAVVPPGNPKAVADLLLAWDQDPEGFASLRRRCLQASRVLHWEKAFETVYPSFKKAVRKRRL